MCIYIYIYTHIYTNMFLYIYAVVGDHGGCQARGLQLAEGDHGLLRPARLRPLRDYHAFVMYVQCVIMCYNVS